MRQAWYDAETDRAFGAPGAWQRAAEAANRAGYAWVEAYTRWRHAEAGLGRRAHRRAAVESLRRAHQLAVSLEAAALLTDVAALAAAGRVSLDAPADPPGPAESPLPRLTGREREILSHVLAGRTYAEIAKALVISEKTVSVHVANMLRKTGTANRTELAILAQRRSGSGERGGQAVR